jgi:hypothetical protein
VLKPGVGTNRFSYSFNDPVNKRDPLGNAAVYRDGQYVGQVNLRDSGYSTATGNRRYGDPLPSQIVATNNANRAGSLTLSTQELILRPGRGLPIPGLIPKAATEALADYLNGRGYFFVTYTVRSPNFPGRVYSGRTRGFGSPEELVQRRFQYHFELKSLGFVNPTVDQFIAYSAATGYAAIRGREQQLIDHFGGVGSPTVQNRIRGVAIGNIFGPGYWIASNVAFGPLSAYTGRDPFGQLD